LNYQASYAKVTASLLALVAIACWAPASAFASTAHEYEKSFGPDGTEGTQFEGPGAVAVDQGSHDVYVADLGLGTVSKFDENGTPDNFSALGSNEIVGALA
jgi:DNA-binding beta-propeller fold protein YncE